MPTAQTDNAAPHGARYVRSLDGIRGIAILLVVIYHFARAVSDETAVTAAMRSSLVRLWIGVDLFFVLSGYLITAGLLASEGARLGQRLKRFYIRRALRIFPLFYGALVVGTIVCYATKRPLPSWSFWVYLNNYEQGLDLTENWLTHFWSLAVEEQFYLVWPLVVMTGTPRRAIKIASALIAGGLVARFVALLVLPQPVRSIDYFLQHATLTHADGLLLGALLALFTRDAAYGRVFERTRGAVLVVVAMGFLVPSFLASGEDVAARVASAMSFLALGVLFMVFVAYAVEGRLSAPTMRVLESRALVSCGKVSYGMYVFHAPIALAVESPLIALQRGRSTVATIAITVAILAGGALVSWALAMASYHVYERPFLRLKARFAD